MGKLLEYLSSTQPQFRKARLGALYSDFSHLSTSNPDGYNANVSAWQTALTAALEAGQIPSNNATSDCFILTVDEGLLRELESKDYGRPLALGTVLKESRKDFMPIAEFQHATDSIYKKSWTIPGPMQILGWGLRQIGVLGDGSHKMPTGKFVAIKCLEDAAKVLAQRSLAQTSRVDRIMSKKEFGTICGNALNDHHSLSDCDVDVMLKYLARDTGLIAYNNSAVKFKEAGANKVEITTEDETIAELKTLLSSLSIQTTTLGARVEYLAQSAKDHVANQNRVAAMGALRSKKIAETNLAKQTATLNQLEEVYAKIGQAADQVELVRIMEGSTGVLKKFNAEIGGIERVDNIVDELREQMTQVDEVNNVIAEIGQANRVDEDEVDDELVAMEAEEARKREALETKAREAREEKETAELKRRLAELDTVNEMTGQDKENQPSTIAGHEVPIAESTTVLKRLSLEPVAD